MGLFPVANLNEKKVYSEYAAEAFIWEKGHRLIMEVYRWSRLGEHNRILAYMPNAILSGSAKNPSVKLFNAIFFIVSLLLVYTAFWWQRRLILGFLMVLFAGSSPYILYEVYCHENIFSILISNALILLALHLSLLGDKQSKYSWLIPLASGVILASFCHVRNECLAMITACAVTYLFHRPSSLKYKILLICLLAGSFQMTNLMWHKYWESKFNQAYVVVKEHGGIPYNGKRIGGHTFWHPVLCGLGDFDTKYGLKWEDEFVTAYALPIMNKRYRLGLNFTEGSGKIDNFYDQENYYRVFPDEFPQYEEVVKERVMELIAGDPFWYGMIILKRVHTFLAHTSPLYIHIAKLRIPLPFTGYLLLPTLILLILAREWTSIRYLLFTLPAAASSLIIYAKGNNTYNSIYHMILLALLISWFLEWGVRQWKHGHSKEPKNALVKSAAGLETDPSSSA